MPASRCAAASTSAAVGNTGFVGCDIATNGSAATPRSARALFYVTPLRLSRPPLGRHEQGPDFSTKYVHASARNSPVAAVDTDAPPPLGFHGARDARTPSRLPARMRCGVQVALCCAW